MSSSTLASQSVLDGHAHLIASDVRTLVREAQSLFAAAAALTGEKAEQLRDRAMALLDSALTRAQATEQRALAKGKQLAHDADGYVRDNPYRTIAVAAGVGVLFGLVLARK